MASNYLRVVADLVPPGGVQDRRDELAALRAFCTSGRSYGWWQGAPWAGKTALMASLVGNPPEGCSVVCYFISRRSGRNTFTDFTDTVLDQLCLLTGEVLPPGLSIHQRDEHRRRLLEQAAAIAAGAGERVLLVIDGLDEESTSLGTPTIVSTLQPNPPPGLTVVVSSRPNTNVPVANPLRQCAPVVVNPSPHATDVRDLALEELQEFMAGQGLREQIVGFMASAQGGLTSTHLGELLGELPYQIQQVLAKSGIVDHHDTTADPYHRSYVLSHDGLVSSALDALGPARIEQLWNRIHDWAQTYRRQGWPENTPGYLLRGYPQRLFEMRDLDRLRRLALDGARHNRMLDASGGDGAAIREIDTAQQLIVEADQPDLRTAYLLARHRGVLATRSADIPATLPALWLSLGEPQRADALATAVPRERRDHVYRHLSVAAATAGNTKDALRYLENVSATAQLQARIAIATSLAAVGDVATATGIAESITDLYWHSSALATIAQTIAATGELTTARAIAGRAESSARNITAPLPRASALAEAAQATAAAGDRPTAHALATEAEMAARPGTSWFEQSRTLPAVAQAFAAAGDQAHACRVARDAETLARSELPPLLCEIALLYVTEAVAVVCDHSAAREIAESFTDEDRRGWALGLVTKAIAATGDYHGALEIADVITPASRQTDARRATAEAAASAGDYRTARHLADSIGDVDDKITLLVDIAQMMTAAGDHTAARAIAGQVERVIRSRSYPVQQVEPMASLAAALAFIGEHEAAGDIARTITDPDRQVAALVGIAHAATSANHDAAARDLAVEAQAAADHINDAQHRDSALASIAPVMATAGDRAAACNIAGAIGATHRRVSALSAVAEAVAAGGDPESAREILTEAENAAQTAKAGYERGTATASIVQAMAAIGDHDAAMTLARSIFDFGSQDTALAAVAEARASTGQYNAAADVAAAIGGRIRQTSTLVAVARAAATAGELAMATEIAGRAKAAAERIYEPTQHVAALCAVAEVLAVTGDVAAARSTVSQAETVAASAIEPSGRAAALSAIARALAACGEHAAAGKIAGQASSAAQIVPHDGMREAALATVARAAAEARAYDVLASLLSDASAQVIGDAAQDFVSRGEDRAARVLIVRAWMVTDWYEPLLAVAVVDRSLLLRVAAEFNTPLRLDIWQSADPEPMSSDKGGFERLLNYMAGYCDPEEYERWLKDARARIARIEIGGQVKGTGFLVGPDLLMTNWHVVDGVGPGAAAIARFKLGANSAQCLVPFAAGWMVAHSAHVDVAIETSIEGPPSGTWDFALVRLTRAAGDDVIAVGSGAAPGELRGYYILEWDDYNFQPAEPILIFGFPLGRDLLFSTAAPSGAYIIPSGRRVRYDTNTDQGSSGSPVFNREFRIVALHNSAGIGSGANAFNQGVPMHRIGEALRTALAGQQNVLSTLGLG
jgi:hypothetical protein